MARVYNFSACHVHLKLFPLIGSKHFPTFVEAETEFRLFLCDVQLQQAVYGTLCLGCLFIDFGE